MAGTRATDFALDQLMRQKQIASLHPCKEGAEIAQKPAQRRFDLLQTPPRPALLQLSPPPQKALLPCIEELPELGTLL